MQTIKDLEKINKNYVYDKFIQNVDYKHKLIKNYSDSFMQANVRADALNAGSLDIDIVMVKEFLRDTDAVEKQLEKLEAALEERAGDRFDPALGALVDYKPGEVLAHKKLLSGYFKEWASQNGFNGLVKVDNFLSKDQFNSILRNKSLFKDRAFRGTGHGEWEHVVQWFCLTEQHKEKPFLSMLPSELYASLGDGKKGQWDLGFELDVFAMHRNLIGDRWLAKFPVLCELIRGRELKGTTNRLTF